MSTDSMAEAKVVLLGATMVGKTTLVTQFTSGEFDPSIKNTVGACYASKVVPVGDESVKLQIWDTAGQEKFKTLVPMYFRGAKVAILVYSVIEENSLKEVQFWAESVKQGTSQLPAFVVVGNKIDRIDERKVPSDNGKEMAEQIGAEFIEVSAKDGTNVKDLLDIVGAKALAAAKADAPQPKSQKITPSNKKKNCC